MQLLSLEEERQNLELVVEVLNDERGDEMLLEPWKGYGPSDADRLRRIVNAWQKARAEENPALLTAKMTLTTQDEIGLNDFNKKSHLATRLDGTLDIAFPNTSPAYRLFTCLLGSSWHTQALLGGPCKTCERWFVRETARPSIYCSRACSVNGQKAKERRAQRDKLLADIKAATLNYESLSVNSRYRKMGWRKYVMDATGTSQKFLTQMVKRGKIAPPKDA